MKLHLSHLQHTLKTNDPMDEDTFNLAVQALYEDELHTFGSTNFVGWRHFLNQDFAVSMSTYFPFFFPLYYLYVQIIRHCRCMQLRQTATGTQQITFICSLIHQLFHTTCHHVAWYVIHKNPSNQQGNLPSTNNNKLSWHFRSLSLSMR